MHGAGRSNPGWFARLNALHASYQMKSRILSMKMRISAGFQDGIEFEDRTRPEGLSSGLGGKARGASDMTAERRACGSPIADCGFQ
jgi:hypothetical protein